MQKVSVRFDQHLSPTRFAETGRPTGAYRSANGAWVALTSELALLFWPGRALYEGHRLRHRTAVYSGDLHRRIAIFDGARFPINHVAFHRAKPLLAIATGAYDGGFCFEGELWLWNWETNASWRVFSESREIECVRFDGDELIVLVRPRDEDEFGESEAFDVYLGGRVTDLRPFIELGLRDHDDDPRVATLPRVEPRSLGFDDKPKTLPEVRRQWDEVLKHQGFVERSRVWDIAWRDNAHVVAVDEGCLVEQWSTAGQPSFRLSGESHGIQVFRHQNRCFVHGLAENSRSSLYEMVDQKLRPLAQFDHAVLMSQDHHGRFLCRDVGDIGRKRARHDVVIDGTGRVLLELDLGHFDCFNHHVRIDGGESLYFLRGTPATSSEQKVLCAIDRNNTTTERWPWDSAPSHLMCSSACLTPEGTVIRSYYVHDPRPSHGDSYIDCRGSDGSHRWRKKMPAPATCIVALSSGDWLLYALTNGAFGILERQSGNRLFEETLQIDGASSVFLSLAEQGGRIAAGTIDGRVLIGEVVVA